MKNQIAKAAMRRKGRINRKDRKEAQREEKNRDIHDGSRPDLNLSLSPLRLIAAFAINSSFAPHCGLCD
jgi:hypothetical protein